MDPVAWEEFYEFFGPHYLGRAKPSIEIGIKNVMLLLPYFHQFGMHEFIQECDQCLVNEHSDILYSVVQGNQRPFASVDMYEIDFHWDPFNRTSEDDISITESDIDLEDRIERGKIVLDEMLEIIEFADLYGLDLTREHMGSQFGKLLHYKYAHALFDRSVFARLLSMVPLGLDGENKLIMGEGGCKSLFAAIIKIISPDISDFVHDNPVRLISDEQFLINLEMKYRLRGLDATNERVREQVDYVRSLLRP